ncbi:unnamed protein product [Allacma fusca]|uniref:UV radiation resistance-associated gene protein n=1 Tax=Allacma fusca TaxID=39272 RepID=A0A8J2KZZ0_9HEXA|nr:unnamed protein product [Allacma fusca]
MKFCKVEGSAQNFPFNFKKLFSLYPICFAGIKPRCWTNVNIRLRNLIQVIGVNFDPGEDDQLYYTLHLAPMSAPFYTSEKIRGGAIVSWREIEPRQIPSYVPLSASGFVIRVWSSNDGSQPLTSWGIIFKGLHFLGSKGEWNTQGFDTNSIIFRMPFGFFTSLSCLIFKSKIPERYFSFECIQHYELRRNSYTTKTLTELHRIQRSVLEELELARRLRIQIGSYGYSSESDYTTGPTPIHSNLSRLLPSLPKSIANFPLNVSNGPLSNRMLLRVQQGKCKLQLKEDIESKRLIVSLLRDEKARSEGRVFRLKNKTISLEESAGDLMARIHALGRERERLREVKALIQEKKQKLADSRTALNTRKKQLISELLLIYPMQLVEGSKRYSISEVQLPDAEDYGSESGGQVSVALGYTVHLVAMLSFFLGIPLRYPIRHFGSRSRIIDHITSQIPNKEREFPLYFRGREDVYSKYAVYLLNKNIAQLRWYCGLSTPNLRATLPNLFNVLTSRLTIPGWPPSPSESCEMAEELTEETHHQLFKNDISLSLDQGLDQISSTPKAIDARMQSWLRSSFSDLEGGAGGNAVPNEEIHHSRAQNRFLSGWKKKTYSESEDIDPRWLTNSLNLELDLDTRVSISPSPPLRVPMIVVNEAKDCLKVRKRRIGRVEQSNVFPNCDNMTSRQHQVSCLMPRHMLEPSSQTFTPSSSMNEIEKQIKENERRKSICDIGWGAGSATQQGSMLPSAQEPFLIPDLPVVDNYPTTDEDKLDDTIADVVRKLSFMEANLTMTPTTGEGDDLSVLPTVEEGIILDQIEITEDSDVNKNSDDVLHERIKRNKSSPGMEFEEQNASLSSQQQIKNTITVNSSNSGSVREASPGCNKGFDENCGGDEVVVAKCDIPTLLTEQTCDKDVNLLVNSNPVHDSEEDGDGDGRHDKDDPSSLWFRTEALLTSQSFNMVKRRISESN